MPITGFWQIYDRFHVVNKIVEQWNGRTVELWNSEIVEYRKDELNIIVYDTSAQPVINNSVSTRADQHCWEVT